MEHGHCSIIVASTSCASRRGLESSSPWRAMLAVFR
jgi:hypothetical protein